MDYLEAILKAGEPEKLYNSGTLNNLALHTIGSKKVLHITPKNPGVFKLHPYSTKNEPRRFNYPRLAGLPERSIGWRTYQQQEQHTTDVADVGVPVARIFEVGDGYMVREFVEGKTLYEHLIESDTSPVSSWFSDVVISSKRGVIMGDRVTKNSVVRPSGVSVHFDFGFTIMNYEFGIAQALFHSFWHSDKTNNIETAVRDLLNEYVINEDYDLDALRKFLMEGYMGTVVNPDDPRSYLFKKTPHPSINTTPLKQEHWSNVQEAFIRLLK